MMQAQRWPSSAAGTACRRRRVSAWKAKFGGMDVSDAKRLKALEEENAKLKRLYADAMLDNAGLKELLAKHV
jgi:putative transposase